jgi:hypothetical protein
MPKLRNEMSSPACQSCNASDMCGPTASKLKHRKMHRMSKHIKSKRVKYDLGLNFYRAHVHCTYVRPRWARTSAEYRKRIHGVLVILINGNAQALCDV